MVRYNSHTWSPTQNQNKWPKINTTIRPSITLATTKITWLICIPISCSCRCTLLIINISSFFYWPSTFLYIFSLRLTFCFLLSVMGFSSVLLWFSWDVVFLLSVEPFPCSCVFPFPAAARLSLSVSYCGHCLHFLTHRFHHSMKYL